MAQQNARKRVKRENKHGRHRLGRCVDGRGQRRLHLRRQRRLQLRRGAGMETNRHIQFFTGRPERIVLRTADMGNFAQMHGQRWEDHTAMPLGHGPLRLGNRRFHRPDRHETLRDEAITGACPFIDEPIVIGPDASNL